VFFFCGCFFFFRFLGVGAGGGVVHERGPAMILV